MKRHPVIAMAMTAGILAGTAALAQPAVASTASGCSGYEYVQTRRVAAGETQLPWQYAISLQPGPIEVCLDGPDGTDYDLKLLRLVSGGKETVATAPAGSADKSLSYVGPVSGWQVQVTADAAGEYTVGINLP
jgi:streptogrisin C